MIDSTVGKKRQVTCNEQSSDEEDSLAESYGRFLKDWKRFSKHQLMKKKNGLKSNYTFGNSFIRDR
jgi:hypothetical protein